MLIQHKCSSDAVLKSTSLALNKSHTIWLKSHLLAISWLALNGITSMATSKSANASDTMNELEMMRKLRNFRTLMMTRMLPTMAANMMRHIAIALRNVTRSDVASSTLTSLLVALVTLPVSADMLNSVSFCSIYENAAVPNSYSSRERDSCVSSSMLRCLTVQVCGTLVWRAVAARCTVLWSRFSALNGKLKQKAY